MKPSFQLASTGLRSGIEIALQADPIKENHWIANLAEVEHKKKMALVLRGGEIIATEALSAKALAGLSHLAQRRPLVINGLELRQQDLAKLAEEAQRTGKPVWPQSCRTNFISLS